MNATQTELASRMSTRDLLLTIRYLQSIQKRNFPGTLDHDLAGEQLAPLFKEAAKRQQAGEHVPDSQNLDAVMALPE